MNPLESLFPGLALSPYRVTSPKDRVYDCIAWAAGDVTKWWWPDFAGQEFWPAGVARDETLDAFRDAFRAMGFAECDADADEVGYEKVAIYADQGFPTHAARQLASGRWSSKLGALEDVEHELQALVGTEYGAVAQVMKRPKI